MSEIKVTQNLEKAIQGSSNAEEIRSALHAEAAQQGIIVPDALGQPAMVSKAAEPEAKTYTKTEVVAGREMTFEASSAAELERLVGQAHEVAEAVMTTQRTELDRAELTVNRFDLELKFKRGEISAEEYLTESGAVKTYLEQGVPIESLQQVVAKGFQQSWASATEAFLKSVEGADWPGGSKNMELAGQIIQNLGLVESPDKVGALKQAYAHMKSKGMIFEGAVQRAEITKNASPAELIDSWKKGMEAKGRDLNREFTSLFGRS